MPSATEGLRVDLICHAEQVAHVALGCDGKFHAIFHGNGRGTEGEFHVKHFLYSRNGCGTDGHPRVPEDEQMAAELTAYLESFGPTSGNNLCARSAAHFI